MEKNRRPIDAGAGKMKQIIKKLVSGTVHKSGLYKLTSFNTRVLAFHKVNPKYFEQQIKHLVKHYDVIPLSEISPKNKNKVVLTFDDGYKNNLEYAYPILKKYKLSATIFIVYDFIDKNVFVWWDRLEYAKANVDLENIKKLNNEEIEKKVAQITSLNKNTTKPSDYNFMNWKDIKKISDVFEIGSHTLTHPILTNIPLVEAKKEILQSKRKIEGKIGKKIISFAYPNGNYNEELISAVEEAGYKFGVIYEKGNIKNQNNFKLFRRGINIEDDLDIFAAKVAGVF